MSDYFFTLQLHISNNCNLNCPYCYHVDHKKHGDLTHEDYKKVISDFVNLCRKWDVKPFLIIAGGEPFFYKKLSDLCEHYHNESDGAEYAILTNATLINKEKLDPIQNHNIRLAQVSLDGCTADEHDRIRGRGSYERTIAGIKALQEAGIFVSVNVVLTKESAKNIRNFFVFSKEQGVKKMSFGRLVPVGLGSVTKTLMLTPQELKEAYDEIYSCSQEFGIDTNLGDGLFSVVDKNLGGKSPVGYTAVTIYDDGVIIPSSRIPIALGNIKTDSLEEIWMNHPVLKVIRDRTSHECMGCEFYETCGGGDEEINFAYWGQFHKTDPQCWLKYSELAPIKENITSVVSAKKRFISSEEIDLKTLSYK